MYLPRHCKILKMLLVQGVDMVKYALSFLEVNIGRHAKNLGLSVHSASIHLHFRRRSCLIALEVGQFLRPTLAEILFIALSKNAWVLQFVP